MPVTTSHNTADQSSAKPNTQSKTWASRFLDGFLPQLGKATAQEVHNVDWGEIAQRIWDWLSGC